MNIVGNQKALSEPTEESGDHIAILIEAATKIKDLVKEMETSKDLTGYIIYKEESEDERKKKDEEDKKLRELIKQNQGG
jgi:hypothetical protein